MFGKGFILREENDMIIKSVNLETVCGITSKLPDNTLPEVAFAGKSNVGKSSLINALTRGFQHSLERHRRSIITILTKNFIM